MMGADQLGDKVTRVPADLRQRRNGVKLKPFLAIDCHVNFHLPDVIERKTFIEESNKWTHRAAGIVVFSLAQ